MLHTDQFYLRDAQRIFGCIFTKFSYLPITWSFLLSKYKEQTSIWICRMILNKKLRAIAYQRETLLVLKILIKLQVKHAYRRRTLSSFFLVIYKELARRKTSMYTVRVRNHYFYFRCIPYFFQLHTITWDQPNMCESPKHTKWKQKIW